MRVTIDIPDAIHAELKRRAAAEGTTMRALILRAIVAGSLENRRSRAQKA
jgi:plasmid stability protein